jgi:hypothetical protein
MRGCFITECIAMFKEGSETILDICDQTCKNYLFVEGFCLSVCFWSNIDSGNCFLSGDHGV